MTSMIHGKGNGAATEQMLRPRDLDQSIQRRPRQAFNAHFRVPIAFDRDVQDGGKLHYAWMAMMAMMAIMAMMATLQQKGWKLLMVFFGVASFHWVAHPNKCKNQHTIPSNAKAPSKAISKSDSQEPDGAFDFWEFNATWREVLSYKKIGSMSYLDILGHTWKKKGLNAASVLVLTASKHPVDPNSMGIVY